MATWEVPRNAASEEEPLPKSGTPLSLWRKQKGLPLTQGAFWIQAIVFLTFDVANSTMTPDEKAG